MGLGSTLNPMTGVPIRRGRCGDRGDTRKEEGPVKMGGETGGAAPSQRHSPRTGCKHQKPQAARKGPPLESPEGARPC